MIQKNPLLPLFGEEKIEKQSRCPLCGVYFNPFESKLLKEDEEHKLVYAKCKGCRNSIVTFYSFDDFGVGVLGLFVDLSEKDAARFMNQDQISADFTIEAYSQIKDQNKLLKLFKSEN